MYSEAIHSTVDTGNELLLLFGMRRADKPPDAEHPFADGLQPYSWVFAVPAKISGLGALVRVHEGVDKSPQHEPVWIASVSSTRTAHPLVLARGPSVVT